MGALREKFRKAREFEVPVGGRLILMVRRPTDLEMADLQGKGYMQGLSGFVFGWKTEAGAAPSEVDLGVENGDPHPVDFDPQDFDEFLSDRGDIFKILLDKIIEAYAGHSKKQAEAAKN